MNNLLVHLSHDQLQNLYNRWHDKISRILGPGGRQYGIDWPTLFVLLPRQYHVGKRIFAEMCLRNRIHRICT